MKIIKLRNISLNDPHLLANLKKASVISNGFQLC